MYYPVAKSQFDDAERAVVSPGDATVGYGSTKVPIYPIPVVSLFLDHQQELSDDEYPSPPPAYPEILEVGYMEGKGSLETISDEKQVVDIRKLSHQPPVGTNRLSLSNVQSSLPESIDSLSITDKNSISAHVGNTTTQPAFGTGQREYPPKVNSHIAPLIDSTTSTVAGPQASQLTPAIEPPRNHGVQVPTAADQQRDLGWRVAERNSNEERQRSIDNTTDIRTDIPLGLSRHTPIVVLDSPPPTPTTPSRRRWIPLPSVSPSFDIPTVLTPQDTVNGPVEGLGLTLF
ncbi:unnamed protein product [Somion occarium]|uniref:Uncharacterized protein n=1 Tax=Somion occarium TaxID=3059160 RepID=A0ABP1DM20_9APHY